MKKLRRSRSAISTLEGALLVLVIIVAAVAGYFGYLASIPPAPAEIVYSDLSVSPSRVFEEEEVTISVVVENTGGSAWTGGVPLLLNGATEATESVTLAAGESKTVTWTVTKAIGSYTVNVGDRVGAFVVGMAIKNPDTLIWGTIAEPQSLDPAWVYETSGATAIQNIYDPLINFWHDPEKVVPNTLDPEELTTPTDEFVPILATEVPTVANGLISEDLKTYKFPIREGVKFHNGNPLTPEDVEYSFERAMVQDRDAGPVWMFLEPLLEVGSTRDGDGNIVVPFEDIDAAVEVEDNYVVFRLKMTYPVTAFMQILCQSWASIVDKEWCIEQGDWNGTKEGYAAWPDGWNNPAVAENTVLYEKAMGTGPWKLERWDHGVEYVLVRNDDYWRGPAKLERVFMKLIPEWSTRKLMFEAGDIDICNVPTQYMPELEGIPGIRCIADLPQLTLGAAYFTHHIDPTSPDIWSGKLDGAGIPPDFFTDKDVRLAFMYAFDQETYIEDAWLGEAVVPSSPIIVGLPYHNPDNPMYSFNLTKAEEHFKKAWGGQVWEKGFRITMLYNIGNIYRKTFLEILKDNIESLNPKFMVYVRGVEWPTFLEAMRAHMTPVFMVGWLADYPDPHNFAYPFMHSGGTYVMRQVYSNSTWDELVEAGISEVDPDKRREIYYKLQLYWYEGVRAICAYQGLGRQWERDWVKGWYYNPIWPGGAPGPCYFWDLEKGY